ncbi:serine/threonine-protein kinase pim-1-like isoform X2 [Xyrichtys novacula]|uniref:non-specific serine/threonine protein kinase n=1 Tax=Xyrichtys novacula TaxID=13765 RepID=A0AAV1ET51_XYRNO|nr:serine/threonine-protein kinase pim-1-like isoform X2 [Xyrichtys novacula]
MKSKSSDLCFFRAEERSFLDPLECRLGERENSCKRKSEEPLNERPSKRSRTSLSPSDSGNLKVHCLSLSSDSSTESSVCSGSFLDPLECRLGEHENSCKRKSEEPLNERSSKRSRTSLSPSDSGNLKVHCLSLSSDSSTESSVCSKDSWFPFLSSESVPKTKSSSKRKATTDVTEESPRKRGRLTATAEDHLETSKGNLHVSSAEIFYSNTSAALHAKYTERDLLGVGGYGAVYDGFRNEDNLPVAIKHIPQSRVKRISINEENIDSVPLEVVIMQKVQSGTPGTSAVVALLDWYDLEEELILVLERPVPCMDLFDYVLRTESHITESEEIILTKQLVDALIEIHSRGVFHNDIKLDNFLIEYGSAVPRVRLIDFGCSTFLTEGTYHSRQGTSVFSSPEWFITKSYRAEPATVWQLGVAVYTMVHGCYPFDTTEEVIYNELHVDRKLSNNCKDFLFKSLSKNPETRATLAALRDHPWLA